MPGIRIPAAAAIAAGLALCAMGAAAQDSPDQLRAKGKVLFEKAAGGIGCAHCHGIGGRGKADVASPPIRGMGQDQIYAALQTRAQMLFLRNKLSDDDITAIAEYLRELGKQP